MEADELVRAALVGDQRAWRKLYHRLAPELQRYFARRFPSSEVDDLVQTTLAAVFTKLSLFEDRGDSAFLRWVYGFARFETQKATRTRKRRDNRLAALARHEPPPPTTPVSNIDRVQRLAILRRQMKKLSEAQQRAIENDLAEGDAKTLAVALNIKRKSTKMLRSRARKELRKQVLEWMANPRARTPTPPRRTPPTPKRTPTAMRTPTK